MYVLQSSAVTSLVGASSKPVSNMRQGANRKALPKTFHVQDEESAIKSSLADEYLIIMYPLACIVNRTSKEATEIDRE